MCVDKSQWEDVWKIKAIYETAKPTAIIETEPKQHLTLISEELAQ